MRELEAPPEAAGSSSERGVAVCNVRLASVAHPASDSSHELVMWRSHDWECATRTGRSNLTMRQAGCSPPSLRRIVASEPPGRRSGDLYFHARSQSAAYWCWGRGGPACLELLPVSAVGLGETSGCRVSIGRLRPGMGIARLFQDRHLKGVYKRMGHEAAAIR